jgi:hypothetical protein
LDRTTRISKISAFFFLALFIIGTAPKTYVHELLANHIDRRGCSLNHKTAVLHQHEINCGFDELVVPVPFIPTAEQSFSVLTFSFENKTFDSYQTSFQKFLQHKDNRGPPRA